MLSITSWIIAEIIADKDGPASEFLILDKPGTLFIVRRQDCMLMPYSGSIRSSMSKNVFSV